MQLREQLSMASVPVPQTSFISEAVVSPMGTSPIRNSGNSGAAVPQNPPADGARCQPSRPLMARMCQFKFEMTGLPCWSELLWNNWSEQEKIIQLTSESSKRVGLND